MIDKRKVALIVGHTAKEPGALACPPISEHEYQFNTALAQKLSVTLQEDFEPMIYFRDGKTILETIEFVQKAEPDCSIELHFNAEPSGLAQGTQTLTNPKWEDFAVAVQNAMLKALKRVGREDRGIEIISPGDKVDRGWENVSGLYFPNVLIEPFFGTSVSDCKLMVSSEQEFCEAIHQALVTYFLFQESQGPLPPSEQEQ